MSTRDFDLSDILTITEGSLVSTRHIDGVYDILGYMTGEDLFTHALPRATDACRPVLLAQHPQLDGIEAPWTDGLMDGMDNDARCEWVDRWVAEMKATYGDTLPVSPLSEWHSINPIQELREMTENTVPIIPVIVG